MTTKQILKKLFGASANGLNIESKMLTGYAKLGDDAICVLGAVDGTYINNEGALKLSKHVLDCIENHKGASIVMLVDSDGQEPNRIAEMLGLANYFGHLLATLQLARKKGHKLITIATGKAIGGAFICYGMFADKIYALDTASVGLMPVEAMSAVTKIPVETLKDLSQKMPALEFGAEPFAQLGGVEAVWLSDSDLAALLADAIESCNSDDTRALLGKKRKGRTQAYDVMNRVLAETAK